MFWERLPTETRCIRKTPRLLAYAQQVGTRVKPPLFLSSSISAARQSLTASSGREERGSGGVPCWWSWRLRACLKLNQLPAVVALQG